MREYTGLNSWTLFGLCLHFAVNVSLRRGIVRQFLQDEKIQLRHEICDEIAKIDDEINGPKTRTEGSLRVNGCLMCTMLEISLRSATLINLEPFQDAITIPHDIKAWEHSISRGRKSRLEFKTARNV